MQFDADGMAVHYIEDDARLQEICERLSRAKIIALDTEFVRTNTFYSRLGLLQLSDGEECFLIDPLGVADWEPFRALLQNEKCVFVVHSSSEDLSVLLTRLGVLPARLFDTQLAAAFLNEGFSLSYQALVESLLGITVSKEETRSDWLQRPLSATQLHYAALDVRYLHPVYEQLQERLAAADKLVWCEHECAQLLQTAHALEDEAGWDSLFAGVSNAWKLNDQGLVYLQALTIWREREARRRDRPRSWIAKDNELQAIAFCLSRDKVEFSQSGLRQINDVPRKFADRYGRDLLDAMREQEASSQRPDKSLLNSPLSAGDRKRLKQCQQACREVAEKWQMAPELLGKKKYLLSLLQQAGNRSAIWAGDYDDWRRPLLQPLLDPLLAGSANAVARDDNSDPGEQNA